MSTAIYKKNVKESSQILTNDLNRLHSSCKKLELINSKELDEGALFSFTASAEKTEMLSKMIIYERLNTLFVDKNHLPHVIILGKPGGGKTSFCKELAKKYEYDHLSIGDIHRRENREKTEIGLRIQKCVERKDFFCQEMVEITKELLDKRIEDIFARKKKFIFDNFPTALCYLPYMNEIVDKYDLRGKVILIVPELSDDEAEQRLLGRVICSKRGCENIYSLSNKTFASRKKGRCDECGAPLRKRIDDKATNSSHKKTLYKDKSKVYKKYIYPTINSISESGEIETFFIDSSDLWRLLEKKQTSTPFKYTMYSIPILVTIGFFLYKKRNAVSEIIAKALY